MLEAPVHTPDRVHPTPEGVHACPTMQEVPLRSYGDAVAW